jgi:hypothetical protein
MEPNRLGRERLCRQISAQLTDRGRYLVSSPDADDLDTLRAAGFRTWRTIKSRRRLAGVLAAGTLAEDAVSVRHSLLAASSVRQLRGVVSSIVGWTVNDMDRALQLRRLGTGGPTSDSRQIMARLRVNLA